jgi:hypothetical protein
MIGVDIVVVASKIHGHLMATSSLQRIVVDTKGLSVTSFKFNEKNKYSSWVDNLLGYKGIVRAWGSISSIESRISYFNSEFKLPSYSVWPPCSIEILGYIKLDMDEPLKFPTLEKVRDFHVSRNATLNITMNTKKIETWQCFYRLMKEEWRGSDQYRPTFFFCPAPAQFGSCNQVLDAVSEVITVQLHHLTLSTSFSANLKRRPQQQQDIATTGDTAGASPQEKKLDLAVCLTLPYTSPKPAFNEANVYILKAWIQHYSQLGFLVLIYDKGGLHRDVVFKNDSAGMKHRIKKRCYCLHALYVNAYIYILTIIIILL